MRGALLILIIATGGAIILFFHREYLKIAMMKVLFDYVTILFLVIIGVIIYSFFSLDKVRGLLEKIIGLLQKYRLFQKHPAPQVWVRRIETWVEEFISSFKYIFKENSGIGIWPYTYGTDKFDRVYDERNRTRYFYRS